MSISSVGSSPGSGASQYLAELLSRLKASSTTSATAITTDPTTTAPASSTGQTDTSNAATGTQSPTLSDQVIGALVMMQMQGGAPPDPSATAAGDPSSQAFASLDTDGDGALSQSELETAVQNAGGTADEADTVFASLGGTANAGISENSFAQAAQQGGPPPGSPPLGGPQGAHHHHGHHHGQTQDAAASASSIFSALDSDDDGSVSADELAAALTGTTGASSGTTAGTSGTSTGDIFAAIDGNGDGSVSQNELTTYLGNLQQQVQNGQAQLNSFTQLAAQSYGNAMSLFAGTVGTQSATA